MLTATRRCATHKETVKSKTNVSPKNCSGGPLQSPRLNLILSFGFRPGSSSSGWLDLLELQFSRLKNGTVTHLPYGVFVWIAYDTMCKSECLTHSKCSISVSCYHCHHHRHSVTIIITQRRCQSQGADSEICMQKVC